MRFHLIPVSLAIRKKSTNSNAREGVGKGNPLHFWWKCKLVHHYVLQYGGPLRKLKIEVPHHPAVSLLGTYPDKIII